MHALESPHRGDSNEYKTYNCVENGKDFPKSSPHHENIPNRYNFDPLNPHFYIVKLGFIGYTLFFLLLLKNIDCGYSLEPPRRGGSNKYPKSIFLAEI